MVDGGVEHRLDALRVVGLCHNPHQLGDGGFQCHIVGLNQSVAFFGNVSNLIDLHIAAFIHDLRGHHNNLSVGNQLVHLFEEVAVRCAGQTADAVAFDDDRIIMLANPGQQVRLHAGISLTKQTLGLMSL